MSGPSTQFDTDDPKAVSQKKKLKKVDIDRDQEYLRVVLSSISGRAVLWDILSRAGIYRTSFGGGNDNTNMLEGKRLIGLELVVDIYDADENAYALMRKEAVSRDTIDAAKQENTDDG